MSVHNERLNEELDEMGWVQLGEDTDQAERE